MHRINEKVVCIMSNLPTHYKFKIYYQKVGQHTRGKCLIHGTEHRKENQMQSLEPSSRISN